MRLASALLAIAALWPILNVALLPPPKDGWFWNVVHVALFMSIAVQMVSLALYVFSRERDKKPVATTNIIVAATTVLALFYFHIS